jgi:hypothetical protein
MTSDASNSNGTTRYREQDDPVQVVKGSDLLDALQLHNLVPDRSTAMGRLQILAVALGMSATLAGVVMAGTTDAAQTESSKTVRPEQYETDRALTFGRERMIGKVVEVNNQAKTFTVIAKGKSVAFSGAQLSKLPMVGEVVDITYTETPGGGPFTSIQLNSSRSNAY